MQVSGPRKCVRMQRLCGRFSETKFCLPWMPAGWFAFSRQQSWTKVLRHFCVSEAFSNAHSPTPPLTPETMLDECIQNFYRVSALCTVGGERTAGKCRKGCTVLRGNREITWKYEYCSTVTRTFVQDCRNCNTTLEGTSQFGGVKARYSCRSTEPRQAHKEELREIISSGCYK